MGTVVVNVMLKPEIADTEGEVLVRRFAEGGFEQFVDVRQGKRFVLAVTGPVTPEVLQAARRAAEQFLTDGSKDQVVSVRDGADEAVDWDDMPESWEDGAMVTAAQEMREHGQDPSVARGGPSGRGHPVSPEVLHDLSGIGGFGVYGGGEDEER